VVASAEVLVVPLLKTRPRPKAVVKALGSDCAKAGISLFIFVLSVYARKIVRMQISSRQ
jgi:hypothetical protein